MTALLLNQVGDILNHFNIQADCDFTAAAGGDWGYVRGWELQGNGRWLIAYGDKRGPDYAMASSGKELGEWLIGKGLKGFDLYLQQAHVYGSQHFAGMEAEHCDEYAILCIRHYYNLRLNAHYVIDGEGNDLFFGSRAEALDQVVKEEYRTCPLVRDECSPPDYIVVGV